jgi:hypothetical protein
MEVYTTKEIGSAIGVEGKVIIIFDPNDEKIPIDVFNKTWREYDFDEIPAHHKSLKKKCEDLLIAGKEHDITDLPQRFVEIITNRWPMFLGAMEE